MPSIINIDNGQISGTPAVRITAAGDGVLQIQNNGNTSMTVKADGEVQTNVIQSGIIKSLTGNTAMSVSDAGVVTFPQSIEDRKPLFSAFNDQSITTSTYVTMNLTVSIDTDTWFSTGNNRYTPKIAGYYRATHTLTGTSASNNVSAIIVRIDKNGGSISARVYRAPAANNMSGYIDTIVYMNGVDDYFTWQAWVNGTSPSAQSYVTVELLRRGAA